MFIVHAYKHRGTELHAHRKPKIKNRINIYVVDINNLAELARLTTF